MHADTITMGAVRHRENASVQPAVMLRPMDTIGTLRATRQASGESCVRGAIEQRLPR